MNIFGNRNMEHENIDDIIDSPNTYDNASADLLRAMMKDRYNRRQRTRTILLCVYCAFFYVLGIAGAVMFFQTEQTRYQIMYASLFVYFMQRAALVKTIGWQRLNKHSIAREIKGLEIRIAELSKTVKEK